MIFLIGSMQELGKMNSESLHREQAVAATHITVWLELAEAAPTSEDRQTPSKLARMVKPAER